jgi:CelD/BcsL family acetyltransferase involved in cellulose biosynthesis
MIAHERMGAPRMRKISVDIGRPDPSLGEGWDDLVGRAGGNVFMSPAALEAADTGTFATIHVLRAWDEASEPRRLVGLWAVQALRLFWLGPLILAAPPFDYAFLSSPVLDPGVIEDVIAAFFDAIAGDRRLPNVLRLKYLDGDSASFAAIVSALGARQSPYLELARRERPHVSKDHGVKHSGSTRKKLRQDWKRLSALGSVEVVNDRAAAAVQQAFETFLAMEAQSWKGAQGTALLCDEDDAAFVRKLIANLTAQDAASVALLRVDGRAVAAQVLLYCGRTAYTWKTAFDAGFGKYSPGTLLVDRMTEELLSSGRIDAIESCSPEGSFMAQLWEGRRATVDALVDVGQRKSLTFTLAALGEHAYARLRTLRDRLRAWSMRGGARDATRSAPAPSGPRIG